MALRNPPSVLGATGQLWTAQNARLALGASFQPSAAALGGKSGCLAGPDGTMGELTLVNSTTLRVNPFLAIVQGTVDSRQGQYIVPNDALVNLTLTGQHASQFRRSLVVLYVLDSVVLGTGTDGAVLTTVDGALASSNPQLPAVPNNALVLGELSIPPVGQSVTLTPYNPRTIGRGGLLPVLASDATLGVYVGQPRAHPTNGLELWDGTRWASPSPLGAWVDDVKSTTYGAPITGFANLPSMGARSVQVPPGRTLEVELDIPFVTLAQGTNANVQLYIGGPSGLNPEAAANWSTGTGVAIGLPMAKLSASWTNTGTTTVAGQFSVTGQCTTGSTSVAAGNGTVRLRHRVS